MPDGTPSSARALSRRYSWVALALSAIAGSVDGIGYLLLFHVFTSHMSGNTVGAIVHLASGGWREAWLHTEPIVAFFLGIIVGLALTDIVLAVKSPRVFAIVSGAELLFLVAFVAVARPAAQWMLVLPAAAMGVQNAMLRRAGDHRVRTTFITGMMTNTAQGLVETVRSHILRDGKQREHFADFAFYGGILVCFAAGGVAGAFLEMSGRALAMLLPICGLSALLVADLFAPFTETGSS